ncbi:hypothetical protein COBT_002800, partial [Conglomerata obtusa]
NEKLQKYDILANELWMIYKCKTRIVRYALRETDLLQSSKKYYRLLEIPAETEAYIQTIALKKTLELIYLNRRRGIEEEDNEFEVEKALRL